jgi:hypothetical protein
MIAPTPAKAQDAHSSEFDSLTGLVGVTRGGVDHFRFPFVLLCLAESGVADHSLSQVYHNLQVLSRSCKNFLEP